MNHGPCRLNRLSVTVNVSASVSLSVNVASMPIECNFTNSLNNALSYCSMSFVCTMLAQLRESTLTVRCIEMVIDFSQGKIIVTAHEVQIRLNVASVVLQAMAEDIQLRRDALVIIADAGVVRWSVKLDNLIQFEQVLNELGIDAL